MTSTLTRLALVLSLALGPLAADAAAQDAPAKTAAAPAPQPTRDTARRQ